MQPFTGNFSMHIPAGTASGTYHPLDGKGAIVATSATVGEPPVDNFSTSSTTALITSIHVPATGAAPSLALYHENGQRAMLCSLASGEPGKGFWEFPGGGLRLTGEWYVQLVDAAGADDWTILFQVE